MGIPVEFNPDLALRDISEFNAGRRKIEECIPENLEEGSVYEFLKKEQRIYYLLGEVSLIETTSKGGLFSKPRAVVEILEVVHFKKDNEVYTRGKYKVSKVLEVDNDLPFEKCSMVKK